MERRLLRILGIGGLLISAFLFVARIRLEPLPSGIRTLFKMTAEDPANTRLAQARDESVEAWWALRRQRDRAEFTAIIGLSVFSIATLLIAARLPKSKPKSKPPAQQVSP